MTSLLHRVTIAVAVAVLCMHVVRGDYFQEYEKMMLSELSRQATSQLQDEFRVHDTPKEIDIFCPGSPVVTIKDLMANAESAFIEGGECMVVNLRGENFSFKLSLNCEEAKRSSFFYDGETAR